MKKVFITGASGFIGSHLTERMVKLGYKVKALVPYNIENSWGWLDHSHKEIKDNIEIISGDICDQDLINKTVNGIDIIFHLAALISIPYSYISPRSYVSTNIVGTLNILEAMKMNNVELMVNTSTSEVYGTSQYSPIDEKHPLNAQSPYAATKIAADQICLSYYRSFGLPITVIRPFNTFGPRQSLRAAIPTMITQAINNPNNFKIGNLKSMRDFSYVDDTVDGYIKSINNSKCLGEIINLGTGYDVSMEEVLELIKKNLKIEINVQIDKTRLRPVKSEVDHLLSDNKKSEKLLNWKPKFYGKEGFEKGIVKTINWFREEKNLKLYKSDLYNV